MGERSTGSTTASPKPHLNPNAAAWTPPSVKMTATPSAAAENAPSTPGAKSSPSPSTKKALTFKPSPGAKEFVPRFTAPIYIPQGAMSTGAVAPMTPTQEFSFTVEKSTPQQTPKSVKSSSKNHVTSPLSRSSPPVPSPGLHFTVGEVEIAVADMGKDSVQAADTEPETNNVRENGVSHSPRKSTETKQLDGTPMKEEKDAAVQKDVVALHSEGMQDGQSSKETVVASSAKKQSRQWKRKDMEEEEELEEGEIREQKQPQDASPSWRKSTTKSTATASSYRYTIQELFDLRSFRVTCPDMLKKAPCYIGAELPAEDDRAGKKRRGGGGERGKHSRHNRDPSPPPEPFEPVPTNEETRWVPSIQKRARGAEAEEDSSLQIIKKAKSILNRLSIEKFDKLSNEFVHVGIRDEELLGNVIRIIVEKAQMEWHFSEMYANLCLLLSSTPLPGVQEKEDGVFRRLLLVQCQTEFEREDEEIKDLEGLSPDERMEKELTVKRKSLGHIRFIGELYKKGLLAPKILHNCIVLLFGDIEEPDEESIECLCKLLTTVGERLEASPNAIANEKKRSNTREAIQTYFSLLRQLAEQKKLSTRVRFMIQDLLELRQNSWIARRKEEKAKTIAEVREEAARDQDRRAAPSTSASSQLERRPSSSAFMRSNSQDARFGDDGEGWETVGGNKGKRGGSSGRQGPDEGRYGGSRKPFSSGNRGTSDNVNRPPNLRRGSSANTERTNGGYLRKEPLFRSTSVAGLEKIRVDRREEKRGDQRGTGENARRQGANRKVAGAPPVYRRNESTQSSEEQKPIEEKPSQELSKEEFKRKASALLLEYFVGGDIAEAVTCVRELQSPSLHPEFIVLSLNLVMEKGDKDRDLLSSLLAQLVEDGVFGKEDTVIAGFKDILEFLEDVELDVPKAVEYMGQVLSSLVVREVIGMKDIIAILSDFSYGGNKAAELVIQTLSSIRKTEGNERVEGALVEVKADLPSLMSEDKSVEAVDALMASRGLNLSC